MTLVGLDIGTTTICGMVVDAGTGKILSTVTRPNTSRLEVQKPWEALQDPRVILETAQDILEAFLREHQSVGGVGVAGQMHGILYADAAGRAVSPLYTWQDGRGDLRDGDGSTAASRLSQALATRLSTGMGIVTHAWNSAHGLVPRDAASLCTIPDYVAMRLGRCAAPRMDASLAASIGGFARGRRDFRRDDLDALGLDPRLFPKVSDTFPVLGEARKGVPVFTAAGDNQASFLGSVRDVSSTVLFNVGTGSQVSVRVDSDTDIPGLDLRPFPFAGSLAVGAALCGGRAYALLRNFFERTVRLFSAGEAAVSWEIMNAVSDSSLPPGGAGRLTVDTRFSGTREDPTVRGSISGIGEGSLTPEHFILGVREGIAAELLGFYERVPPGRRAGVSEMAGSGNGARLNPALRDIFQRRLGMPMRLPAHVEETSFGAALIAGVARGVMPDLNAAGQLVRYA